MSLSRKIAHNTILQMVGKIISTGLGLFSLALITRYLGQEGFGEYTTVITYLTIFAVIADFGLTLVTVQMISGQKDPAEEQHILNNLFSFRLITILALLLISPLFLFFLPYSPAVKLGIVITTAYFIFPALTQIIIGLLQKKLSMDRAALAEVLSRLILIAGIFLVWEINAGLNGILLATVASGAASFLFHYFFAKKFAALRLAWDFSLWKEIIRRSWPLAVTVILNLIYLRADIIFLSLFKGSAEVGLYGAAYKIVDVLTTIPFMFAGLVLPVLTAAWLKENNQYFRKILQRSFDFMSILALPLIVGGLMLSKPVMVAVAGEEFKNSGPILGMLIIAVSAIFLGTIFSHAVIALNKQKKLIGFYAFTSATSLAAYLILIPRFSYFGAAAVTIYSEILIALFSAFCVFKYSRFKPAWHIATKSLLASIFMGIIINWLPSSWQHNIFGLGIIIALAGGAYLAALFLLGGLSPKDLSSIFKKSSSGQPYGPSNL